MKIMVPYSIEYDGDFRLKDNFLEGQFLSDKGELKLYLKTVKKEYLYISTITLASAF